MSTYQAIRVVTDQLRNMLWNAFQEDSGVSTIVQNLTDIVFLNPTETNRNSAYRLSLWLYQVTENEFVKNSPLPTSNNHLTGPYPPLALNLYFLVTPFAGSPENDYILLGRTMQVLYDNAILYLRDVPDGVAEELRIVLCRLTLEELSRVWEALREPYRLSVAYQVRVLHIESRRLESHGRVMDARRAYGPVPGDASLNNSPLVGG